MDMKQFQIFEMQNVSLFGIGRYLYGEIKKK